MVGKRKLIEILKVNNKSLEYLTKFNRNSNRYFTKKEARQLLEIAEISLNNYPEFKRKIITGRPKIYTKEENKQRNKDRLNKANLIKRQNKNKNLV
jgi:hypothetical protein